MTSERPISDLMAQESIDGLRIVARGCVSYLDQAEKTILRLLDERHRLKAELAQSRAEGLPFLAEDAPAPGHPAAIHALRHACAAALEALTAEDRPQDVYLVRRLREALELYAEIRHPAKEAT